MPDPIEALLGRWLALWVAAVARHPWKVTCAMLLATAGSLVYSARNLEIQGDTESLFSGDLPYRQAERRYQEAFPMLYENLFVVVDGPTPEGATQAATQLAGRLHSDREHFHTAFVPTGGAFFEENAFLYLSTDELEDLADRLARVQPYLNGLARDGSLANLSSLVARGVRAVREGDVSGDSLVAIFDGLDAAIRASLEERPFRLSWSGVLAGDALAHDPGPAFLLAQPVLDHSSLQPAAAAIEAVRRAAHALELTGERGFRVRVTGDAALSYEEMEIVKVQAAGAGFASFVLVALILFLGLRSARLVLSVLLTLLVGLVFTGAFATAAVGHLNLISVTFAVLFIGLGVDFGIHLCIRYRELLGRERPHAEALEETARDVGSSILLCALTTAIGFFAFVPTDFVGVAELGLIAGGGMFVSFFCSVTLLPALLSLPPVLSPGELASGAAFSARGLVALPLRHPRMVRAAAIALGAGAVLLLPEARFDNNPLRVRDPSSESVRAFSDLLERGGSSPWSLNVVAPDLDSAEALAAELRGLDVVERVVTVSDLIPRDQVRKLDLIDDVALFLPASGSTGAEPGPPDRERTTAALSVLSRELRRLLAGGAPPPLSASAMRLRESLGEYSHSLEASPDPDASLARLETSVTGSLPAQLRLLQAALSAGHVTLENLPTALLERMITEDGRVRIEIFPSEDLGDQKALARFVDGVREIAPEVAGSASEILESGRAVVRALRQALLGAVVAVTLFLLLLWRSINDTALVMVPLGLAASFTVAASVLLDVPFNFADVIVLPLLLGIGVDSGIHLVHRARVAWPREQNLLGTSTARAVAYSALTTIASFGTMAFATHLGLATLGRMLVLGVGFTLLCNLLLLPSLIALHRPRRVRVGKPASVSPPVRSS